MINIEKIDLIEEVKDIKTPQEEIETKVSEKIEMIKEILEITEEEDLEVSIKKTIEQEIGIKDIIGMITIGIIEIIIGIIEIIEIEKIEEKDIINL